MKRTHALSVAGRVILVGALALSGLTATARAEPAATDGSARCPAPTPGLTLPRWSDHGVNQAQVFDRQVPDPSVYAGRVSFVWAALQAEQPEGVVASSYVTAFRSAPARQFTPAWFKENHPDWIMYTADKTTPAWEFNNTVYTPLDYTNPEVRAWYLENLIEPALARGFKIIAVDNVGIRNDFKRAGHYDKDGNWVQQYSEDRADPAYVESVIEWMTTLRDVLHSRGITAAYNITYHGALHDQFQDTTPQYQVDMRRLIAIPDIWLNEQGFTVHRPENVTDSEWKGMFDLIRDFRCKPMVMDNKLPTPTWQEADPMQRQWVVANYFLYREAPTMLVSTGMKDYAQFNEIPELEADLGRATTAPFRTRTGLWTRDYEQGSAVVNPSSTKEARLTLRDGTWTDLAGNSYRGTVIIPPNTGLVLKHTR